MGLDTIKGGGGNADELVGSLPAKLKLNTCSENSTLLGLTGLDSVLELLLLLL